MIRSLPYATVPGVLRIALVIFLIVSLCGPATAATIDSNRLVRSTIGSLPIASMTGWLTVDSTPQGAEVLIDGTSAGVTPLRNYTISPGTHTILLTLSGFQDSAATVDVASGEVLAVSYKMATSRGRFTSLEVQKVETLPVQFSKITALPSTGPSPAAETWITGSMSSATLNCTEPGDKLVFQGLSENVSTGTSITFTIFNMPPGTTPALPAFGVVIGTTQVKSDSSWKFTWNGGVPGYALTPGEVYLVKASLSPTKYLKFGVLYLCQPSDQWMTGSMSSTFINCTQPTETVSIFGSSGNMSAGTPLTFTIYDYPGAAKKVLPDTGILLGTALLQPDGTWKYIWNGAVPGYTLTAGDPYMIKTRRTATNYLKFGILYQCQPANVPAALLNSLPVSGLQKIPVSGEVVQQLTGNGVSSGQGSSGDSSTEGGDVAVSPHLNPQPEPPAPFKPIFDFFNSLFGGPKPNPK